MYVYREISTLDALTAPLRFQYTPLPLTDGVAYLQGAQASRPWKSPTKLAPDFMETELRGISAAKRDRQEAKGLSSDSSPEEQPKRGRMSERGLAATVDENIAMDKSLIELIQGMSDRMISIQADITAMRSEAESRNKEFEAMRDMLMEDRENREREMKEVKSEIGGVAENVRAINEEIQAMQNENIIMKARLESMERDARKCNIVVSGIEFKTPREGYEELQKVVNEATDSAVRVTGIRTFETLDHKKLIVASCQNFEDKMLLLAKKRSLQYRRGDKVEPVYVNNDLSKVDRETQRHLRAIARNKREQGCHVKIAGNRIKMDDVWYSWNPTTEKLETRKQDSAFRNKEPPNGDMECPRPKMQNEGHQ